MGVGNGRLGFVLFLAMYFGELGGGVLGMVVSAYSCREMVSKTTSDNGRLSRICVKRVRNARRKRLEIRQMRPKCQSEAGVGDGRETKSNAEQCSTEISISFSSLSSLPSSSENDAIPAKKTESFLPPPYGTVSVIGRRREMEDAVRAEQGFWSGSGGELRLLRGLRRARRG